MTSGVACFKIFNLRISEPLGLGLATKKWDWFWCGFFPDYFWLLYILLIYYVFLNVTGIEKDFLENGWESIHSIHARSSIRLKWNTILNQKTIELWWLHSHKLKHGRLENGRFPSFKDVFSYWKWGMSFQRSLCDAPELGTQNPSGLGSHLAEVWLQVVERSKEIGFILEQIFWKECIQS